MRSFNQLKDMLPMMTADWNGHNWRVFCEIDGIPFAAYSPSLAKACKRIIAVAERR